MVLNRPFVYIASLRRTGSTVLAEALTSFPMSFIFREPELGRGRFNLRPGDAELFAAHGVDLKAIQARLAGRSISRSVRARVSGRLSSLVAGFKSQVVDPLDGIVSQWGVKEIRHEGWESYFEQFSEMRTILTGRDPRDIYISLHHRIRQGKGTWQGPLTPRGLADDLMSEFAQQLEIEKRGACLRVKYEDLCTDPAVIHKALRFVESPLVSPGGVGGFNVENPHRREEAVLHGGEITNKRVRRWASETDRQLLDAANEMYSLMGEYCESWGYAV